MSRKIPIINLQDDDPEEYDQHNSLREALLPNATRPTHRTKRPSPPLQVGGSIYHMQREPAGAVRDRFGSINRSRQQSIQQQGQQLFGNNTQNYPNSLRYTTNLVNEIKPTGQQFLDVGGFEQPASKRSSIILPHLRDEEKRFFDFVAEGAVDVVKAFITERPQFNYNCVNFQGVSALHVAIQTRSEAMVTYLLSLSNIDVSDCILYAIRDNQPRLVLLILEKLHNVSPGLEFAGAMHSSEFPEYITPVILAAQCGHYEIIEMLIDRGHKIDPPHPPYCRCKQCLVQADTDDLLNASAARLNIYRAIANPAYIAQSSLDPVLSSFLISQELQQRASKESEFRAAYLSLSNEVSRFAVELIGQCRSTEEVELILIQKTGTESGIGGPFPRLALAMDLKQKDFVAHPNCQLVLRDVWLGDYKSWISTPAIVKCCLLIPRVVMLPIICVMCIVIPNNTQVKRWTSPINKLLSHLSSYFLFLIFIFLQSSIDKANQKRGPPTSGLEGVLVVYVLGYTWSCVRMGLIQGPSRYFHSLYNCADVIMHILFLCTFFFWFASMIDVQVNGQKDLERKYWHHYDPILLAEGFFTVGVIIAFFRLLFLCQLDYTLGPLQISLGKMSADIAKYIIVFFVLILSFLAGLSHFYSYYRGMTQTDLSGSKTSQQASFVDFLPTFKTLFWALFCMSPIESADVIIENLPGGADNTTVINYHYFTEAVGYIIFACFELLAVIVILNMLIATMSNTFQRVNDNVDVEWTFARTAIYLEYMAQTNVPSPYNLIPTPSGIKGLLSSVKGQGNFFGVNIAPPNDARSEKDFPVLMALLVQRYFRDHDNSEQQNDLEVVKNELLELKTILKCIGGPNC